MTAYVVGIGLRPSLGLDAVCVAAVRDHPRDFAQVGLNWVVCLQGLRVDVAYGECGTQAA